MELTSERVEIPVDGGAMPAYVARPSESGTPYAGVVVWMEIFGVNRHIRDVADRVAREGYVAVAPNFFHRTAPVLDLGYDDAAMQEGLGHMRRLDAESMITDARAAVGYLHGRGDTTGAVGTVGFCVGGHMAYLTACECDVQAAASYYGGGIAAPEGPGGRASTVSRTPKIRGALHAFFGARDAMIPAEQVEAVRKALEEAGVRHEVVVYEGAGHGFHCDERDSFDEEAAGDAWQKTLALFDRELRR